MLTTELLANHLPRSNVLMLFFGAALTALISLGVSYTERTVSEISNTARNLAVLQSDTTSRITALRDMMIATNRQLEQAYRAELGLRDERVKQIVIQIQAIDQRLIHVERLLITGLRKQALKEDNQSPPVMDEKDQ